MLVEAHVDMRKLWVRIKADGMAIKPSMRSIAYAAVRSFLRTHGEFPPYDRLQRPGKVRRSARITWAQASKICDAAAAPYRHLFRLQLHCGWGIGEFFEWNRQENWDAARKLLQQFPRPEYYQFEFPGRKTNDQPFYSLIPTLALDEIYASEAPLPLATRLHPLDHAHYLASKNAVDSAFKTALQRSGIAVNGHLSPHDLRDTFRTEATIRGVDYDAREFALGHTVDPRGYDKCYSDLGWLWKELSKLYIPAAPKLEAINKENQELRNALTEVTKEVARLRGQVETVLMKQINAD
jgi:integrase